jgi:hypothetical protein
MKKRLQLLLLICFCLTAVVPLSAASICDGVAGNLVTNCGFETGDFTGWTFTGNTGFSGVTSSSPYVNSGTFGAQLGPVGSDGLLTQTLATLPGTVSITFYLYNDGGTPNDFTVFWNGVDVGPSFVDDGSRSYTLVGGSVSSTGGDTLTFAFRQDPAFWGLDDVVVTQTSSATPEPGTVSLLLSGLGLVFAGIRRRRV